MPASLPMTVVTAQQQQLQGKTDKTGPMDEPAGDGVSNLLKYALGMDPLSSDRSELPQVGLISESALGLSPHNPEAQFLSLTFEYPRGTTDIDYIIEAGYSPASLIP